MRRNSNPTQVHPMRPDQFEACAELIDIGSGLFLYSDAEGSFALGDACDVEPDRWFGPAAWGGAHGPASCRCLLEVESVHRGEWRRSGLGEWVWASDDGMQSKEPLFWPARIRVVPGERSALFAHLNRAVVVNIEVLIHLLQTSSARRPVQPLRMVSARERMISLSRALPDGDESGVQAVAH